jgi:hypothetical protein
MPDDDPMLGTKFYGGHTHIFVQVDIFCNIISKICVQQNIKVSSLGQHSLKTCWSSWKKYYITISDCPVILLYLFWRLIPVSIGTQAFFTYIV